MVKNVARLNKPKVPIRALLIAKEPWDEIQLDDHPDYGCKSNHLRRVCMTLCESGALLLISQKPASWVRVPPKHAVLCSLLAKGPVSVSIARKAGLSDYCIDNAIAEGVVMRIDDALVPSKLARPCIGELYDVAKKGYNTARTIKEKTGFSHQFVKTALELLEADGLMRKARGRSILWYRNHPDGMRLMPSDRDTRSIMRHLPWQDYPEPLTPRQVCSVMGWHPDCEAAVHRALDAVSCEDGHAVEAFENGTYG